MVAITSGVVTAQAYEYTGGLAPGHRARPQGGPLSARLGPGLLGRIFDGLLRPLSGSEDWLLPGSGGAEPRGVPGPSPLPWQSAIR